MVIGKTNLKVTKPELIDILASLTKGKPLGFNYLKSSEK